jgi:hypothetical protein
MVKKTLQEEKKDLSREDIQGKIKRLQGYIAKTERQIATHEKALTRLREKMRKEMQKTMGSVLRGKIYG